jgi:hypothetical protein
MPAARAGEVEGRAAIASSFEYRPSLFYDGNSTYAGGVTSTQTITVTPGVTTPWLSG